MTDLIVVPALEEAVNKGKQENKELMSHDPSNWHHAMQSLPCTSSKNTHKVSLETKSTS
jgi:hypothetical protein